MPTRNKDRADGMDQSKRDFEAIYHATARSASSPHLRLFFLSHSTLLLACPNKLKMPAIAAQIHLIRARRAYVAVLVVAVASLLSSVLSSAQIQVVIRPCAKIIERQMFVPSPREIKAARLSVAHPLAKVCPPPLSALATSCAPEAHYKPKRS